MLLADGWPTDSLLHSRSRRIRKPAHTKPVDPRKTVKRTPRGKYGLPPRIGKRSQLDEGELPEAFSSRRASYVDFYQQLVDGTWPGLLNQQQQRQQLFPHKTAATPGLKRKVCPVLNTTQHWPRLQRKMLPKYLLVLDDELGILLLKSLAWLQPAAVTSYSKSNADSNAGSFHSSSIPVRGRTGTAVYAGVEQVQHRPASGHQQQQLLAPHRLLIAEQVPTSITGALNSRYKTRSKTAGPTDSAANAAAVSRGFADAVEERVQFELMLAAVYSVFQHRLQMWNARRLMKAICHVAQLQLYHDGFMQAWFEATAPILQQQHVLHLAVCLEALAKLSARVPDTWLASFVAASKGRLGQLTLAQQALLQMHIVELQLQLPGSWWGELYSCALQHATAAPASLPGMDDDAAPSALIKQQQAAASGDGLQQQQQSPGRVVTSQERRLSRPAADALCGLLWSSSSLRGRGQRQGMIAFAELLLPALSANKCSAGAVVQLLHACSLGACQQLPVAPDVCRACLDSLQARLGKVCAGRVLQLLLQCLRVQGVQQQLPPGWCEGLEAALMPELVFLPTQLLLQVAAVFDECMYKPGVGFMSGFVLATSERLSSMTSTEIVALVGSCTGMAVEVPHVWAVAVMQQLQRVCTVQARGNQAPVDIQTRTDAVAAVISRRNVMQAVQGLKKLVADWSAVQAACRSTSEDLQHSARC